ncbi:MAG: GNAT family protein [candidate division WOR-3 bacterium]
MKKEKPVIFLEGKKVILSPIEEDDLFTIQKILNDPDVRKNLAERFPRNRMMLKELISLNKEKKGIFFKIVEKENFDIVGLISLSDFNWPNRRAMLAIAIDKNFQNRGYGTESTKLLVDYGFKNLQLHKICLEVYDFNKNAIKMYKNLGFKREGVFKKHSFKDGKYVDLIFMSLLNE